MTDPTAVIDAPPDPMAEMLRAHDARMNAMSADAIARTQDRCDEMMRQIAEHDPDHAAMDRAISLRDKVNEVIGVPPNADVSSGITPANLIWLPVRGAVFHDLDTAKGVARQRIAWTGSQDIDATTSGFRFLGFDACEISHQRQTVGVISDAEIAQGIKGRDAANGMLEAGGVLQVAEDETLRQDTTYDRRLAWGRIVLPNKSIVNLAEFAKANSYDRNVFLSQNLP
jgi:hypothetical protein